MRAILAAASAVSAGDLLRDQERLDELRVATRALFDQADALLLPTVPFQPTLAEAQADSIAVNRRLGTFTNFVNLLDLNAIAVPAGTADGGHFGVTLLAPAFGDRVVADLAAQLAGEPVLHGGPPAVELLVVGAHRSGQPLNHQLTGRGARRLGTVRTAAGYRLPALRTQPPKPGLVRVSDGAGRSKASCGRSRSPPSARSWRPCRRRWRWRQVRLADGREVVGFTCEQVALDDAPDITEHGSWPAYLASSEARINHRKEPV